MERRIDLERLSQAFTDHPWLAEAVSNGAWWNGDGSFRVVTPVEDPMELRAGLFALADALGCDPSDVGVARAASAPGEEDRPRHASITARRVGTR